MKKYMVLCAGLAVAFAFTSCKSSESAYRKAYEKAKAQETTTTVVSPGTETTVVAPVVTRPATETVVVDNVDNAVVRPENVQLINGSGLRNFSVVVGSFGVKANAEGLQQTLKNQGYDAQIVYNSARNMYRVVASTFDDKASAVRSRNDFKAGSYPDAWLLYNQQ